MKRKNIQLFIKTGKNKDYITEKNIVRHANSRCRANVRNLYKQHCNGAGINKIRKLHVKITRD